MVRQYKIHTNLDGTDDKVWDVKRAMVANGRFGGHIVSGHIDGTGTIASKVPEGNAQIVTISCKNLFLCNAQKTRFYLLMMPGNKKFKTKNLSKQINSARLSFAGDEYMEQFLDITPGSVSILGLANDKENQVQLLIDSDVLKDPFLGCHPCINTSSLKIKTADLTEKFLPAVHHSYITVDLPWED